MEFTTHTNHHKHIDVSFNGLETFLKENKKIDFIDIDECVDYGVVNWTFYTEMRSWGVKSIGAYVNSITLELDLELLVEELPTEFVHKNIDLSLDIKDFEIITNDQRNIDSVLTVQEIEYDFEKKQITVTF